MSAPPVKKRKLTNDDRPFMTPAGRPLDPVENRSPISLRTVINWTPEEQDDRESEPALAPSQISISDVFGRLMSNPGVRVGNFISKEEVIFICIEAQKLFLSQPAMLELQPPLHVLGDTHGHYSDTLRIFNKCGFPPESNYLFLGNYVDHGRHSVENIMLLLTCKLLYPESFFLLRGHHENVLVNRQLQFKYICLDHFGSFRVFMAFQEEFNVMQLSALIGGRILCVHGGISPKLDSLQDLLDIPRPMIPQTPSEISSLIDGNLKRLTEIAHDIVLSEPENFLSGSNGFAYSVALANVIEKLDLDFVVRGNLLVQDGHEFYFDNRLLTLVSAPHFMGVHNNRAAVLIVKGDMRCSVTMFQPTQPADQGGRNDVLEADVFEV